MSIKNVVPLLNVSAMFSFQEFVKPVTVLESDCQKILKRRNEDERVHGGSPTIHLLNVLLTYICSLQHEHRHSHYSSPSHDFSSLQLRYQCLSILLDEYTFKCILLWSLVICVRFGDGNKQILIS